MAQQLPIRFEELVQLKSVGIEETSITFNSCVSLPQLPNTLYCFFRHV